MSMDIFHFQHGSSVIYNIRNSALIFYCGGRGIQQVSSEEDNHFASLTDN